MPNAKLVARLAGHIERWPTVYDSDRKNRAILQEALEEIMRLSLVIDSISWQPLDTAPKDGTPIDMWSRRGRITNARWLTPVCHVEEYKAWCAEEYEECGSYGLTQLVYVEIDPEPTHWMPVPADPSIAISSQAD